MSDRKNLYGDDLGAKTTGTHGADICAQRADNLDQACTAFAQSRLLGDMKVTALDIGGGSGAQTKRLAALGASVVMVDLSDQWRPLITENIRLGRRAIRFIQRDIRDVGPEDLPKPVDIVYSQRTVSYLPYQDTLNLFRRLAGLCAHGAHVFVSSSGLFTEFGETYPDRDKPVADRFAPLAPPMADKHGIHQKQCLYTAEELAGLLQTAGFCIESQQTSRFGNPKIIASLG